MEKHLAQNEVDFATLTGASRNRGKIIDRFNNDPACRVFVGSLKAGGIGIDLVAASVVIHYDRWWNAAREDQATDRAFRRGEEAYGILGNLDAFLLSGQPMGLIGFGNLGRALLPADAHAPGPRVLSQVAIDEMSRNHTAGWIHVSEESREAVSAASR